MFGFNVIPGAPPTRRCAICRRLEVPESGKLIRAMWICSDCAAEIRPQIKEVTDHEVNSAAEDP